MAPKIYKLVLLGEGGVGKTALRHRYLGQGFKQNYQMTIGADFAAKRDTVDGETITAQIWDLAGQIRFSKVREGYYKGAVGALLVFDIVRRNTFEIIPEWLDELLRNNNEKMVPIILIGNKGDLRGMDQNEVTVEEAENYARALSEWSEFEVPYIETSALTGEQVDEAFQKLIRNINQYLAKQREEYYRNKGT